MQTFSFTRRSSLALIVGQLWTPHTPFHLYGIVALVIGVSGWTLVEYAMHRVVLHAVPVLRTMHDMHHKNPGAYVGTPAWVSLAAFVLGAFAPVWWSFGFEIASGSTAGLMLGYCWYLIVHVAVHHWQLEPGSPLYAAKLRHAGHHYRSAEGNFGVTIALWDRLLKTELNKACRTCTRYQNGLIALEPTRDAGPPLSLLRPESPHHYPACNTGAPIFEAFGDPRATCEAKVRSTHRER